MSLSAFDLFSIGIGPSSSHTVGPMRAAHLFITRLQQDARLASVARVRVDLFGSLGATGHGHGTIQAVMLGLQGEQPHLVDPQTADVRVERSSAEGSLRLAGEHPVPFDWRNDIVMHRRERLDFHSNGMRFAAFDAAETLIDQREYFSVGGGFVLDQDETGRTIAVVDTTPVPYPFHSGAELVALCESTGLRVSDLVMENELVRRSEADVRAGLLHIWEVMQQTIERGCEATGTLPGGLKVRRRAAAQRAQLTQKVDLDDPLRAMEWVTLFALAVNEENAAGGRIVTAPTNGAAGIIPAVLAYYTRFVPGASDDDVVRFLLAATAIGILFKENASISGAEVGCQGEVGSACSMAAAGLAEVLGGSAKQVEMAAEIGIEHNLGLTCDPVGGLVQIPCIERNAVGAVKAITAARMAVRTDGEHHVSLDAAIKTMRETGADMKDKYKETSRGGLALNVVEC
ncbi:L-serine ammonia-lyase [Subtercola boreus]|uniref:L-serine dehydratase n=1 Tax=Subtercola boreus TaxID=120213 RepID=A0A3E0WBW1_9MICO|nr:L-serine ammonia-lyase [Subtercola boreus]RFA19787.1 L-serine ammonia-lyase [Subtercola boreus]RFA19812.1 L-serine ammonia-lyase [Subtercola boreus]RFA26207.1 L-serine ammonia-lyase [Subtercola boreus]